MPIQMNNSNPLSLSSNGKRKSAFSLYKPTATVLTNLQRGNTEANVQAEISLNFHERAGQGEITEMQARQQPNIDEVDRNRLTPLHWACFYGQLSSVKILLNCGASVSKLAPDHVSPLLLAAAGGHHEIVKLLLQNGADPDHTDIVSRSYPPPIRIHVNLCTCFDILKVGNTALMFAAAGNHPHTCHELLNYKPNIFATNENDDTAYSLAVQNNASLAQAVVENHVVSLLTS